MNLQVEYFKKVFLRPSLLAESTKKNIKWLHKKLVVQPFKFLRKHALSFLVFKCPSQAPAPKSNKSPDYIIWGVIDWHFRHQRPQQIAQKLAETDRRVFYISSNFVDDTRAGFAVEPLDDNGQLFQVKLYINKPPIIYFTSPSSDSIRQLKASIGQLLSWTESRFTISLVQHPFWFDIARFLPNSCMVYDCIDHHEGFGNNSNDVLSLEYKLFRDADLTVCTSGWLDQLASKYTEYHTLLRNACDFDHFSCRPQKIYSDNHSRRIIGYYGAIANWFDLDLIEAVANRFKDCCILLVGSDTVGAQLRFAHLQNVVFTGEAAYSDLPYYLYSFDVAILPFKVIPLTLATNPVKVYEYLSAGKPVVSVDLPEMSEFGDLVAVANSTENFLVSIANELDVDITQDAINKRQNFAIHQTWGHRVRDLIEKAEVIPEPLISVVIATHNNLDFTRSCLHSLEELSDYNNLEIIIIDNASTDGTKEFLSQWVNVAPNRKCIFNETNRGFAAANNQGLAIASGMYLVLLNNDTYVTPGWCRTLYRHLKRNNSIGLIGPVTNSIGNEAKISITYKNMDEMLSKASQYTCKHVGSVIPLRTTAFFCVMFSKETYDKVGPLDEQFGIGFFEDDDYCRRVEEIGLTMACARDVFVHHHLSATFFTFERDTRRKIFADSKKKYEAKWGTWQQ